jgi:hypothetical protein
MITNKLVHFERNPNSKPLMRTKQDQNHPERVAFALQGAFHHLKHLNRVELNLAQCFAMIRLWDYGFIKPWKAAPVFGLQVVPWLSDNGPSVNYCPKNCEEPRQHWV